jgi:uncharacterized repeat protein (TIGR02543 family)
VTYEENGGSAVLDELVVPSGGYATEPDPTPTLEGYAFAGWFTDDGTFLNQFDFRYDTIIENTTLYAKWTKLPDLFISEYGEPDGGNCKYIEIYNPTGTPVDLSTYAVNKASNGGGWGTALALSGTLNAGETIVIAASACTLATDAAQTEGNPAYPTTGITEVIWGSASWNGDDAVGLFKGGALIDVIGTPDIDPGSFWAVGNGNTTDGNTANTILIRVPSVMYGTTDWSVGATQWIVAADDRDYSTVGSHTVNP